MLQNVQLPQINDNLAIVDKTVAIAKARSTFSQIIEDVQFRQESYIIQKNGREVGAIVPVSVLRSWRKQRMARFAVIDLIQQQTAKLNLNEDEINAMIRDAVREVREENTSMSQK